MMLVAGQEQASYRQDVIKVCIKLYLALIAMEFDFMICNSEIKS